MGTSEFSYLKKKGIEKKTNLITSIQNLKFFITTTNGV